MIGRKAIFGVCMLCVLAVSALAAQGATAVTKGTTAFTCKEKKEPVGPGFSKAHCRPADAVSTGAKYEHVAIPEHTTTEITGTNAKTSAETTQSSVWRLKTVVAGLEVELSATGLHAEGWATNAIDPTGEHYVHGTGSAVFTGVAVTKPAGKGCKVFTDDDSGPEPKEGAEGVVDTEPLVATTTQQGDFLKFQPDEGDVLASFWITCTPKFPALEGTWQVTGSVKGVPDGATVNFTHAETTAQGTLKVKGNKAGLEGSVTFSGRDPELKETIYTPLSATTVETP